MRGIIKLFAIPNRNRLKENIISGDITPDFYIPSKFIRILTLGYFIIDTGTGKIFYDNEVYELDDLKSIATGYEDRGKESEDMAPGVIWLTFGHGNQPKKKVVISTYEEALQQKQRLINFLGW